ncbi:MAG TPA: site-specific integrase [Candidatus Faecousia intestinigallinarum]|nr:site-specific integrase [Candidatus Faecousia intestinigallinarum]
MVVGTYATRAEAQAALSRLVDADVTEAYNLTFQNIYDAWKPVHAREVSASQMACYAAAFRQCEALHDMKFRVLRKSDFQAVILDMERAGKSKSSCEKVLQLFGQLSKWAMDESIIVQDYSANVRTTAEAKSTRRPFSRRDIRAMEASQLPAAQIALILIATGARPGELFSAELEKCHEDHFVGGSKTAAGRNRVIVVASVGREAYKRLLQSARESGGDRLIDGYSGNRGSANFARRDFRVLMDEIGTPGMTPYHCRHIFSTMAAKSGVSPQALRRMMGHTDIKTADKFYTHLDPSNLLCEVEKIGGL